MQFPERHNTSSNQTISPQTHSVVDSSVEWLFENLKETRGKLSERWSKGNRTLRLSSEQESWAFCYTKQHRLLIIKGFGCEIRFSGQTWLNTSTTWWFLLIAWRRLSKNVLCPHAIYWKADLNTWKNPENVQQIFKEFHFALKNLMKSFREFEKLWKLLIKISFNSIYATIFNELVFNEKSSVLPKHNSFCFSPFPDTILPFIHPHFSLPISFLQHFSEQEKFLILD